MPKPLSKRLDIPMRISNKSKFTKDAYSHIDRDNSEYFLNLAKQISYEEYFFNRCYIEQTNSSINKPKVRDIGILKPPVFTKTSDTSFEPKQYKMLISEVAKIPPNSISISIPMSIVCSGLFIFAIFISPFLVHLRKIIIDIIDKIINNFK